MRDLVLLSGFSFMLLWGFKYPHVGVLLWCWTALIVPRFRFQVCGIHTVQQTCCNRDPYCLARVQGAQEAVVELNGCFTGDIWNLGHDFCADERFLVRCGDARMGQVRKDCPVFLGCCGFDCIERPDRCAALCDLFFAGISWHHRRVEVRRHGLAPESAPSIIADNNHFALAMIALLPVVLYLYKQATHKWRNWPLSAQVFW